MITSVTELLLWPVGLCRRSTARLRTDLRAVVMHERPTPGCAQATRRRSVPTQDRVEGHTSTEVPRSSRHKHNVCFPTFFNILLLFFRLLLLYSLITLLRLLLPFEFLSVGECRRGRYNGCATVSTTHSSSFARFVVVVPAARQLLGVCSVGGGESAAALVEPLPSGYSVSGHDERRRA